MVDFDDHSIIKKVREGDVEAFAQIVERHQQTIFNLTFQMTGSEEDARDLTQEIFIRAYLNLDKVDPRYKFFSWLYRLGVNHTLDHIRQRKPYAGIEGVEVHDRQTGDEIADSRAKRENVRKAIRKLQPKYRLLIVMKYYSAMSYDQMSSITGIPQKKVKSRLFEARQMLRNMLLSSSESI
jgi:RNA polymerase sigma-70 factor (ECF subfamily)